MIGSTNVPGLSYSQVTNMVAGSDLADRVAKMNNIQTLHFAATDWTGSGPYTQTLNNVVGYNDAPITATDKPEIFYNAEAAGISTVDAYETYAEECGYISKIATGAGTLTATAYAQPTMEIYFDLKGV